MKADHSHQPHMPGSQKPAEKADNIGSISESDFQKLFESIYYEHVDTLIKFAYFRLTDQEKAVDVVQDVYANYFAYLKNIRENPEKHAEKGVVNHRAFLFKSLRNSIIDQYRSKKSYSLDSMIEEGYETDVESDEDVTSGTETSLTHKYVIEKIKTLKPEQQELLYMRYIEDMTIPEMATALGERENTISVKLHRVIETLKKHVT
ncbi:MAG: hypothetical protein RJB39_317 [Candidatus Parcubacteria bacterium]|jgi:RNA polymerase sigma factor (sigma-70 family)